LNRDEWLGGMAEVLSSSVQFCEVRHTGLYLNLAPPCSVPTAADLSFRRGNSGEACPSRPYSNPLKLISY
jgi:hypothetical protein